jgi:hypothetical protein
MVFSWFFTISHGDYFCRGHEHEARKPLDKEIKNDYTKLKIETWPIERLVPYARNARLHSEAQVAQIAASISEFGFNCVPIVAVICSPRASASSCQQAHGGQSTATRQCI